MRERFELPQPEGRFRINLRGGNRSAPARVKVVEACGAMAIRGGTCDAIKFAQYGYRYVAEVPFR